MVENVMTLIFAVAVFWFFVRVLSKKQKPQSKNLAEKQTQKANLQNTQNEQNTQNTKKTANSLYVRKEQKSQQEPSRDVVLTIDETEFRFAPSFSLVRLISGDLEVFRAIFSHIDEQYDELQGNIARAHVKGEIAEIFARLNEASEFYEHFCRYETHNAHAMSPKAKAQIEAKKREAVENIRQILTTVKLSDIKLTKSKFLYTGNLKKM